MPFRTAQVAPRVAAIVLFAFIAGAGLLRAQGVPDPERVLREREQEYQASIRRSQDSGFHEDVRGRDEWFTFQRRFPYDVIPAGAFSRAIEQTEAMESRLVTARAKGNAQAHTLAASRWEPIGPMNIAGRIPALAHHPTKPGVIFIGAASGGVWKSTDDGLTWATTFDKQQSLTIGALAIDYTDPNIIYAGTGEPYPHSEDYRSHGMYKSTDEGATWRNVGLTSVGGFSKIWVHREHHNIVYAAAAKDGGAFYRSTDAGATWTSMFSGTIYDMSVDPHNSDVLFIATPNSIYYSVDAGASFQRRATGINVSSATRISVGLAPTRPGRVYALVARNLGFGVPNAAESYISNDTGRTWQFLRRFENGFFNEQGHYDNAVLVHPDSADIVLMLGIDCDRSENAGVNFLNTTDSYNGGGVHPDQHVIEFDPKDHSHVLLGNDGGLYASEDAGTTWHRVSFTLPITQFYKMDVSSYDETLVYGGTQDNGSLGSFGPQIAQKMWSGISGGDGFFVAADPNNIGIVYSEVYYGSPIYRCNTLAQNDVVQIDQFVEQFNDKGDWSSPLVMSLADGAIYSGRRALWRTRDGGGTWDRLTPGTSGLMSAVAVSPLNPKLIIGTNAGEVRYSTNDGLTWQRSAGIPQRFVADLRYDLNNDAHIYACVSGFGTGHVFRSDDDGATFTDITGNLPDAPFNTVLPDLDNADHIFAGTDAGVFVTFNGGKLWYPLNEGMPRVPVVDLRIYEPTRTLIAATHGRSMFRLRLTNLEAQPFVVQPVGGATYQTPTKLPVKWYGFNGPVRVSLSLDGVTFTQVADGVTDSTQIDVGLVRSSNARVRVESVAAGASAETDDFNLTPRANGAEQTSRGFIGEAIEYRKGTIWCTVRGSDVIARLRMPLLGGRTDLTRTGIPGRVRDMAYDSVADRFYMLVVAEDFSGPHLYRMDTNAVGQGEVPLPPEIDHAGGVAMTGEGIAIVAPGGAGARVWVLNDSGRVLRTVQGYAAGADSDRRSLAWDGGGLVQGVVTADSDPLLASTFEQAPIADSLRVRERIPAVLPSGKRTEFFGIAIDNSNPSQLTYVVTDTAGTFYKFTLAFSGVEDRSGASTGAGRGIHLASVVPNPLRSTMTAHFTTARAGGLTLDLYRTDGSRAAQLFDGTMEAGEHAVTIHDLDIASGLYYLVAATSRGERDVRPVVVMH